MSHRKQRRSFHQSVAPSAEDPQQTFREQSPAFRFNKFDFDACSREDLVAILSTLQKMEQLTWNDVLKLKGLDYKPPYPEDELFSKFRHKVPEDARVYSVRVSRAARLYGYRFENVFYLVFYDPTHQYS